MKKLFVSTFILSLVFVAAPVFALQCSNLAFSGTDSDLFMGYNAVGQLEPASSFVPSISCTIDSVAIRLAKSPGRTEDAFVKIYSDSGGNPDTVLETSLDFAATYSSYPTYAWATTTFSGSVELLAGTTYWLGVASHTTNDSIYLLASSGGGGSGTKNWNGTNWTSVAPNTTTLMPFNIDGIPTLQLSAAGNIASIITFDF